MHKGLAFSRNPKKKDQGLLLHEVHQAHKVDTSHFKIIGHHNNHFEKVRTTKAIRQLLPTAVTSSFA